MPAERRFPNPQEAMSQDSAGPPRAASVFARIDGLVLALNRSLMIAALAAMSVIVFCAVVLRYASDYSIPWSEEVARYLMVWLTFLGIGPVMRVGGHVAIDTIQSVVPAGPAQLLRVLTQALAGVFCALLAWFGLALIERTIEQTTAVTEISFAWVSAAIPIGGLLGVWHLVAVARSYIVDRRYETSKDLNPEELSA
jgi:TRAP-type C4-dicarboxylate transport system permease small subunit